MGRAVSALLRLDDHADVPAVISALKAIPSAAWEAIIPFSVSDEIRPMLLDMLPRVDAAARRALIAPLTRARDVEEEDRVVLSEDFDGLHPYRDPLEPITPTQVADSAVALGVEPAAIVARLERLAEWLPLDLSQVTSPAAQGNGALPSSPL
jgi:hypothetical protein